MLPQKSKNASLNGVVVEKKKRVGLQLGFTKENELFVGRAAMLGFAFSLIGGWWMCVVAITLCGCAHTVNTLLCQCQCCRAASLVVQICVIALTKSRGLDLKWPSPHTLPYLYHIAAHTALCLPLMPYFSTPWQSVMASTQQA